MVRQVSPSSKFSDTPCRTYGTGRLDSRTVVELFYNKTGWVTYSNSSHVKTNKWGINCYRYGGYGWIWDELHVTNTMFRCFGGRYAFRIICHQVAQKGAATSFRRRAASRNFDAIFPGMGRGNGV